MVILLEYKEDKEEETAEECTRSNVSTAHSSPTLGWK